MSGPDDDWEARIVVRLPDGASAGWLAAALAPEASRDVPRARAEVRSVDATTVELVVTARDTGAIRAALNTYLGWVHLALSTARAARGASTA
jgi:tRNA threonylcarbamoyladenosine modification (KEOPS) complex  Pcc1 subunit